MLKKIKKPIIGLLDWLLYKGISTKQKEKLSSVLTKEQKKLIKKIMNPGKKRSQLRQIERIKNRLYNLGFVDRGLNELELLFQSNQFELSKMAAWELAIYHANKYTEFDARKCLEYLDAYVKKEKDSDLIRKSIILRAECMDILGENKEGKKLVKKEIEKNPHPDLLLAMGNLEELIEDRLVWINKVYSSYDISSINLDLETEACAYDSIVIPKPKNRLKTHPVKVTIIIPAYNAQDTIRSSIESILAQSWSNIEVIVVDDCSNDQTVEIVKEYVEKDSRVNLLKTERNSGAYVARNYALKASTGDFITINDADDWSHPEKIRIQAEHLINNKKIVGNFSQQARVTENLKFYRRGKPGIYIFSNMSSFMFRRDPVFKELGFWDEVRFAGDSEYVKRIKARFGEKSVKEVLTAPLSFQRQSENSLTAHSAFGFPGFFMGARKEYAEAHETSHKENPEKLFYHFPMSQRPFAIPEPMWPQKEERREGRRHFDVIIGSEFRLLGGTNMSNLEEIKAQKNAGLKTGLLQLSRYELNSVEFINHKIREQIDGNQVQMVVYGEKLSCDLLILRHPPILQDVQQYIPDIKAKNIVVIVNQPPKRDYSNQGITLYNINQCQENVLNYFGKEPIWFPIGPLVRQALLTQHEAELKSIQLAAEDWMNIININEWRRDKRPQQSGKIKIGRHSRDQYVKWPDSKEELLSIYPDTQKYEVFILGGAKSPTKILGGTIPGNWNVLEFGEMHPREFLSKLDVFVYFTHPDWIEAFGRVIFEAMAVGVPVIIPPRYKSLFGEAAIYAEPNEVRNEIDNLMENEDYYNEQVAKAFQYVEKHFGYTKHLSRLEEFFNGEA
ncbi:glycosyltransferase [Sutcliffiella horikoshii]|uniref:glycosyltransferase n=1 Tax=Sutcliffiella horikoshii TaxID=79883 RepID=UPI00384A93AD